MFSLNFSLKNHIVIKIYADISINVVQIMRRYHFLYQNTHSELLMQKKGKQLGTSTTS